MFLILLVCALLCLALWQLWSIGAPAPPPGHPLIGPWHWWLGNLRMFIRLRDQWHDVVHEALETHKKHVATTIPGQKPMLFLYPDEANFKHIMKDNFDNYHLSEYRTKVLHELLGNGIFASNGHAWLTQRKAASHIFSLRELRGYMASVIVEHGQVVLDKLAKHLHEKPNQSLDLQREFFKLTMDSFAKIAFGENIDSLRQEHVPMASSYDRVQELSIHRLWDPFWTLKRHLGIGREKELKRHATTLYKTADEMIARRKCDFANNRLDLISHFLADAHDKGTSISDIELRDIVLNFLVAGRDTTACALSWLFYELARHPQVEAKVRQEIFEHLRGDPAAASYDVVRSMQYLEYAILEALRLHPSVPSDDKAAIGDDVLPDGTVIKKGQVVGYHIYSWGRLKSIWGEDALVFRPERWINRPVTEYTYAVFNAGKRLCLGRPLALLEAKIVASMLLTKFTFQLDTRVPVEYLITVTLPMKNGLFVFPRPAPAPAVCEAELNQHDGQRQTLPPTAMAADPVDIY